MATIKKYNGSTWENTTARKYETKSEIITPPTTIYTDGTAITSYTIKGNTVQNGTPTPDNPVEVNGVGVRTENLFDYNVTWWRNNLNDSTNHIDTSTTRIKSDIQDISDSNSYISLKIFEPITNLRVIGIGFFGDDVTTKLPGSTTITITNTTIIQQIPTGAKHYFILLGDDTGGITSDTKTALASAQICAIYGDVLPNTFIPYGYKIPISSGGVTTNIYLGSTQTVRQVKKFVLTGQENYTYIGGSSAPFQIEIDGLAAFSTDKCDWLCSHFPSLSYSQWAQSGGSYSAFLSRHNTDAQKYLRFKDVAYSTLADFIAWISAQYAAGTPVTIWYVLATPQTAAVNEPLQKIGDYADTISNATAIPTTEGANSITVDTTVQPSEFTATWTGWHDVTVEEWDGSQWNE